MENIQNVLLQQAVAKKAEPKTSGNGKDDRFRKMMEACGQAEISEDVPQTEMPEKSEKLDLQQMQMLAAMQIMQTNVVPQTEITQPAAELPAETQQIVQNVEASQVLHQEVTQENPSTVVTEMPQVVQQMQSAVKTPETVEVKQPVQEVAVETEAQPDEKPVIPETPRPVEQVSKNPENKLEIAMQQPTEQPRKKENVQVTDSHQPAERFVFRELDTAPVKVSESPVRTEEAPKVETQIMEGLQKGLASGERKIELQLTPHNLGKIRIEVTQKEDSSIHIVLHAEHSEVRALLEKGLPEMQQMLRYNTQQDVQIQVPQQHEDQQLYDEQQNGQHRQQQQQEQHKPQHTEDFLNQLRLGLVTEAAS